MAPMAKCEVCGNVYDKTFTRDHDGREHSRLRRLRVRHPRPRSPMPPLRVHDHRPRHGEREPVLLLRPLRGEGGRSRPGRPPLAGRSPAAAAIRDVRRAVGGCRESTDRPARRPGPGGDAGAHDTVRPACAPRIASRPGSGLGPQRGKRDPARRWRGLPAGPRGARETGPEVPGGRGRRLRAGAGGGCPSRADPRDLEAPRHRDLETRAKGGAPCRRSDARGRRPSRAPAPHEECVSDCIRKGRDPEPSGWEGWADVRIVSAVLRSAHVGRPVLLEPLAKRRPELSQEIRRPAVHEPELLGAFRSPGGPLRERSPSILQSRPPLRPVEPGRPGARVAPELQPPLERGGSAGSGRDASPPSC